MNARVAATLICLCGPAVAAPPGPAEPATATREAATTPRAPARTPPAPAPSERALMLAGIALMAGIALRRAGD